MIMPGFTTHYLFGVDAFSQLSSYPLREKIRINHSAFSLGLQGPDLFFYYLPSYLMHRENIGALAHRKDTRAFFSNLLDSRKLFTGDARSLAVADAYVAGFLGHYSLDCAVHPYVYAFTGYTPENPPGNVEYFGQHAYFETEIDTELLLYKKELLPSEFKQNATIRLSPLERTVVVRMLVYAYRNTYPGLLASEILLGGAPFWMKTGTKLLADPSGRKKVLARLIERVLIGRAFISPMVASDHYCFIQDPMNLSHRTWTHPWTGERSHKSFYDLYYTAMPLYLDRLRRFNHLTRRGCLEDERDAFLNSHGNLSFLSGLPCSDD
jgi:hypothetical protein